MLAAVVILSVVVAGLSVLVYGLLRSHALILRALDELGAGLDLETAAGDTDARAHAHGSSASGAPGPVPVAFGEGVVPATRPHRAAAADIVGTDLDGAQVTVGLGDPTGSTLLAFLSSGCSVCHTFWETFAGRGEGPLDIPTGARLVVITRGPQEESTSTLRRLAGPGLLVVQSEAGWSDFEIPGSPYFVHVEAGQVTGEGSSTSWEQVRSLMGQGVADIAEARAARDARGTSPSAAEAELGRGARDDLPRMDRELLAAGIHPGHVSLYSAPDAPDAPDSPEAQDSEPFHHHHEDGDDHDHHGHGHVHSRDHEDHDLAGGHDSGHRQGHEPAPARS